MIVLTIYHHDLCCVLKLMYDYCAEVHLGGVVNAVVFLFVSIACFDHHWQYVTSYV